MILVILYGTSVVACVVFKNHEVYVLHLIVQVLFLESNLTFFMNNKKRLK